MLPASARTDRVKVQMKGGCSSALPQIVFPYNYYETVFLSLAWDRPSPGVQEVLRRFSMQLNQTRFVWLSMWLPRWL